MQAEQAISTLPVLQTKPEPQMNSQGELITPQSEPQQNQEVQQQPAQLPANFDDVISLGDTELALNFDNLCAPTDDSGMEHKIISWGHVLKSTHDLARWSEKTGARRVNGIEALDAISDLAVNLEPNPNRGRANQGNGSTNANQGSTDASEDISGLFNEGGNKNGRGRRARNGNGQQWKKVEGEGVKSEVINCWPVLKSTHDQAQLSEKRGRNAVNQADTSNALEELALNQGGRGQGGQPKRGGRGAQRQRGQQQAPQEPSAILHSWPVLKSTHDMASLAEKRGPNAVNAAGGAQVLDEVIQNTEGQQQGGQQQQGESAILNSWPVLKSTHDMATWSEKRGANAVNDSAQASQTLEELAKNQGAQQGMQAGGSSLQSGLDTQGGSHVQDSAQ